jgi:TctA family transporter
MKFRLSNFTDVIHIPFWKLIIFALSWAMIGLSVFTLIEHYSPPVNDSVIPLWAFLFFGLILYLFSVIRVFTKPKVEDNHIKDIVDAHK